MKESIFSDFAGNVKRFLRGERPKPRERCVVCHQEIDGVPFIDSDGRKYHSSDEWLFRPALLRRAR